MYLEKQNVMYVIYVNSSLPILVHLKFLFTFLWYYNDHLIRVNEIISSLNVIAFL